MNLQSLLPEELQSLVELQTQLLSSSDTVTPEIAEAARAAIEGAPPEIVEAVNDYFTARQSSQALFDELEALVATEMQKVVEREESMQMILDSMAEGLCTCDTEGRLGEVRSRVVEEWFGDMDEGTSAAAYLFGSATAAKARHFDLALEQVVEDFLPFEVAVEMFPREFSRDDRTYRMKVRAVREFDALTGLLITIRDATAEIRAEQAEAETRETARIVQHAVAHPAAFRVFLDEMDHLCEDVVNASYGADLLRALHTLKGNAASSGFERFARHCHELETQLAEGAEWTSELSTELGTLWANTSHLAHDIVSGDRRSVRLERDEYNAFLESLRDALPLTDHLLRRAERWEAPRVEDYLGTIAAQANRIAAQEGKELQVEVFGAKERIPNAALGPFLASLVHCARNAIAHGLETPAERVASSKHEAGILLFSARYGDDSFVVTVEDDGRGIDWKTLSTRAAAAGLPHSSRAELVDVLFADGLSTQANANELSGRGVGLAAVRSTCIAAGGEASVTSEPGKGTRFTFRFPHRSRTSEDPETPTEPNLHDH